MDEREFGVIEAKVERLEQDMSQVATKLDEIQQTLSEARGGWKTLMLVAGAAGAAGAVVTKIASALGWIKV